MTRDEIEKIKGMTPTTDWIAALCDMALRTEAAEKRLGEAEDFIDWLSANQDNLGDCVKCIKDPMPDDAKCLACAIDKARAYFAGKGKGEK